MKRLMQVRLWCVALLFAAIVPVATPAVPDSAVPDMFTGLLTRDRGSPDVLLKRIDENWHPGMVPMALETLRFLRFRSAIEGLREILERRTGQSFGYDTDAWWRWLWSSPEQRHSAYADFKSELYQHVDPVFEGYFSSERVNTVRLDEIRWGGVRQDGIPPLRYPDMIPGADADYLADSDVVFGLKYGEDARAYPKRILAWHEMFVDRINGVEYAGVYCTLCGAVILYETVHEGTFHALGTSGFLYRSNKVMYDKDTQSLWSTTLGVPMVGPLVGKNIRLQRSFVVTTTWGEWKRRHPETTVLSLDTGHRRNYDEGVAYSDYFASDDLMFTVPKTDARLANKAEVLALTWPERSPQTMAISADFLTANPVLHTNVGEVEFVVLTDTSGANRVYETSGVVIKSYDGNQGVQAEDGSRWEQTEQALLGPGGQRLPRLPAHRAFWFGWVAVHPETELIR